MFYSPESYQGRQGYICDIIYLKKVKIERVNIWNIENFTHVGNSYANFLEQKKDFAFKKKD